MATKRGSGRTRPDRRAARSAERDAFADLDAPSPDASDLDPDDLPAGELADLVIATFGAVVPKPIRRALATGIGAVLLTEEGVRRSLENLKGDPRAVAQELASQVERAREGVNASATREMLGLLKRVENGRDLRRLLHGVTLELTMQVRFSSDDEETGPPRSGFRARISRKART